MKPEVILSLLLLVFAAVCHGDETPKWPRTYTLNGMIQIPYAEIEEPFTAYLTSTYGRSRVDFYGGDTLFNVV